MKTRVTLLSLCLAGLLAAQPGPPPGPGPRGGRGQFGLGGPLSEKRLATALNLSAEQQNKIHTAFEEARVLQKGIAEKNATLRSQLAAAVKAGNEAQIDTVTQEMAQVHQQQTAIRAKSLAKVYASLNADQKTQIDRMLNRELAGLLLPGPYSSSFVCRGRRQDRLHHVPTVMYRVTRGNSSGP
jgi:Spy/CpxP family protein refolding chaperone